MGEHLKEYRGRRGVMHARWKNAASTLAEYRQNLAKAEAAVAELIEEKIPRYREKIEEFKEHVRYAKQRYEREYCGELDSKKERMARIRDSIVKLEQEVARMKRKTRDERVRKRVKRR